MKRLLTELLVMIFENLELRKLNRLAFTCRLWLDCVHVARKKELNFIELFNSSKIKMTCLMPSQLLRLKFYDYLIYTFPKQKNDIKRSIRFITKKSIINSSGQEYFFIGKNLDKLLLDYRVLFMKYDMLSKLTNPGEKEFKKELHDRTIFIDEHMGMLRGRESYNEDECIFWFRHVRAVEKIQEEIGREFYQPKPRMVNVGIQTIE